jgi:hypothetical protein
MLRWKKKVFSIVVKSMTQYCGCTTPNVVMISYSRYHISSFEISPQVAPSHFSLTLFIAMSKTTLVIGWKTITPSIQEL